MMVPRFKKKNLFLIVSGLVILVGVSIFVLAYGIADGWDAVAQWFGSKYAILLYMLVGLYFLIILWLIIGEKVKKL